MTSPDAVPAVLVAGYDASPGGAAAVRWAARRTAGEGTLVVVYAAHPSITHPSPSERSERARAELDALLLSEDDLVRDRLELRVVEDAPASALCRVADEAGAEGIVVGRHHEGPFNADTVHQVLQKARCPVTVVPATREAS